MNDSVRLFLMFCISSMGLNAQEAQWPRIFQTTFFEKVSVEIEAEGTKIGFSPDMGEMGISASPQYFFWKNGPPRYLVFKKCLLLSFERADEKSREYLLFTPFQMYRLLQLDYRFDERSDELSVNGRYLIDCNTGRLKEVLPGTLPDRHESLLEKRIERLRERAHREQAKIDEKMEENAVLSRKMFLEKEALSRLEIELEQKKEAIARLDEKLPLLSEEFARLEQSISSRYLQKQKYEEHLKIVEQNLVYVQGKVQEEAEKLVKIKENVREESRQLASLIVTMDQKKKEFEALPLPQKEGQKVLSEAAHDMTAFKGPQDPRSLLDSVRKSGGNEVEHFFQLGGPSCLFQLSFDRKWMSFSDFKGNILLVSLFSGEKEDRIEPGSWNKHAWAPHTPSILACADGNSIRFHESEKLEVLLEKKFPLSITTVLWHPGGKFVFYGCERGIYRWDMQVLNEPTLCIPGAFDCAAISPKGDIVVYGGQKLSFYDAQYREESHVFLEHFPSLLRYPQENAVYLATLHHGTWQFKLYRKRGAQWKIDLLTQGDDRQEIVQGGEFARNFTVLYSIDKK